jgi:hypothetical protein
MISYLAVDQIPYLHREQLRRYGGQGSRGARSRRGTAGGDLGGEDLYPDIPAKPLP